METRKRIQRLGGNPPYWILASDEGFPEGRRRRGDAYRDILTVDAVQGKVLPLFGSEERAAAFVESLALSGGRKGWRAAQAWSGELLMLLSASGSGVGPCAGVSAVTFDPPEALLDGHAPEDVPTLGKRCFMDRLLGRDGRWSHGR